MRAIVVAVIVMSLSGGCTSTELRQYTLNQSLSVTDMRYQQVLNDLAEVAHNAGTLPGFALTASGIANVTNTVSIDTSTLWDQAVKGFSKETLTAFGQHNPELQWTLDPAVSEPQLEGFRYACLWALFGAPPPGHPAMELLREPRITDINGWTVDGGSPPQTPSTPTRNEISPRRDGRPSSSERDPESGLQGQPPDESELSVPALGPDSWSGGPKWSAPTSVSDSPKTPFHLGVARQLAALPPGWLHVTQNELVPIDVAYRATRGGTTVWVTHDGLAGLSQFTLVMLDIATIDPTTLPITYPKVTVNITEKKGDEPAGCPKLPGLELRLMSPVNDVSKIPTKGENLMIVVTVDKVFHFRVFDGKGNMVENADEIGLPEKAQQIEDLRKQLTGLWPPHSLTASETDKVITAVTSILDYHYVKCMNCPDPTDKTSGDKITGDKITEQWDAGQYIAIPDPNCADPSIVKPIGRIFLSRPKAFQQMTWARPCVVMGKSDVPGGEGTPTAPRSAAPPR